MATSDVQRRLEIKQKVVQRIMKELELYRKEEREERAKVDKLKAEGADPYDIKYAENIMNESIAMVPDAVQRLGVARDDLQAFLDGNASDISGDQLTENRNLIQHAVTMVDA